MNGVVFFPEIDVGGGGGEVQGQIIVAPGRRLFIYRLIIIGYVAYKSGVLRSMTDGFLQVQSLVYREKHRWETTHQ